MFSPLAQVATANHIFQKKPTQTKQYPSSPCGYPMILGNKHCVLAQESLFWPAPCCHWQQVKRSSSSSVLGLICVGDDWRRPQGALVFKLWFCLYCCLSKFPLVMPLQLDAVGWHRVGLCVLPLHGFGEPWGLGVSCCQQLCTISMEKYFSVCECTCREGLCCTNSDLSLLFIYFFYFKRKYLQIVLPLSEMYLMPKAGFLFFFSFLPWLYIWLTWWGKQVKSVTLKGCFCCCPCWVGLGRHFWLLLCLAFPKRVQIWIPTALNLKELLPFLPLAVIEPGGVEDFVLQVVERRTSDLAIVVNKRCKKHSVCEETRCVLL